MNKIILIGRVGKDPEVKHLENTTVASFSIATSEKYTDKNGEKKENTDWHSCVVWGKPAEIIEKYVFKGSQLAIEGKSKMRSYDDKDGVKRYVTEVLVSSFEFIGSNAKKDEGTSTTSAPSHQSNEPDFSVLSNIDLGQEPTDKLPF